MICPEELLIQAKFLGSSTKYVQGAGGNLSIKDSEILWIKASGTRLKDASQKNIFLPMNLTATRNAVLDTEDLTPFCLANGVSEKLRPSIETAIHSLLPHRHVAHVHSVGAIALSISKELKGKLDLLEVDALKIFIPYAKPGIQLANAILENIYEVTADMNLLIILGNHGLIVASQDAETATKIIVNIEKQLFSRKFKKLQLGIEHTNWVEIFPPGTLDPREIGVLSNGPLTPDEVVFLGSEPFSNWDVKNENSNSAIKADGSVWAKTNLGYDGLEIIESFVNIARATNENSEISYLSELDVAGLLNWEAEKWRQIQTK